ncbi:hypothetical protein ACHAWF_006211 [Thalassiosira exigua]
MSASCANCGKGEEGDGDLKRCTACKMAKYCSRDCQVAHRPKHKRECKKRAAELRDEALFRQPPKHEDCPICFLTLPEGEKGTGRTRQTCCGKWICCGCIHAVQMTSEDICPFCRAPTPDQKGVVDNNMKGVERNDADSLNDLGLMYANGFGAFVLQDEGKAVELWQRAAKLGHVGAHHNIAHAYREGLGVEIDEKKSTHYYELAGMGGNVRARHYLGCIELRKFNTARAIKHFRISAGQGNVNSLKNIQGFAENGIATKNDYSQALRAYRQHIDLVKSDQRDEAAAFSDHNIYLFEERGASEMMLGLRVEELDSS